MLALIVSNPIAADEKCYNIQLDQINSEEKAENRNNFFCLPKSGVPLPYLFKSRATLGNLTKKSDKEREGQNKRVRGKEENAT